jgi:putative ABC transport system ATP-binding protein
VTFLSENIIEMKNIVKSFYIGTPNQLNILRNIDINVKKGEFVSIVGTSGSGKSTLMNIIGALDRPTSGTYVLDNTDVNEKSDNSLSEIRNKQIGFVFQTYNLIPRSSALKNVELPMLYNGMGRKERKERAEQLLELVEMKDRMSHQPSELSGGQKQRVAIARALANNPSIILADEPTGALDSSTGRLVMDLFHKIHEQEGKTIVLITHNDELAAETEKIIVLKDGQIISERYNDKYSRRFQVGEELCL